MMVLPFPLTARLLTPVPATLSNRPVTRKGIKRSESFTMDKKKKRMSLQIFHRFALKAEGDKKGSSEPNAEEADEPEGQRSSSDADEDSSSDSSDTDTTESDATKEIKPIDEELAFKRFKESLDSFATRKGPDSYSNLKKVFRCHATI